MAPEPVACTLRATCQVPYCNKPRCKPSSHLDPEEHGNAVPALAPKKHILESSTHFMTTQSYAIARCVERGGNVLPRGSNEQER
jgi:hypothetical protein